MGSNFIVRKSIKTEYIYLLIWHEIKFKLLITKCITLRHKNKDFIMTFGLIPSSVNLTGAPTVPTAVQSVNNNQIASTAYVRQAISGVSSTSVMYDPKAYGAVGDGGSHPASTVYGSLAALQAVYGTTVGGVAVALTQELDWLGTQKAIDLADVTGGTVFSVGSFRYTNTNSVADGSGTLLFPLANYYDLIGCVNWVGILGQSFHKWPNDLGVGRFAVLCAGRTNGTCHGIFEQLDLTGPGVGSTLGASSTNMHGLGTNARRNINQVHVRAFKVGINFVGAQALWQDVLVNACYYGIYWDTPNQFEWGNCEYIRVLSDDNTMAAVGVNHATTMGSSVFRSCFFGNSPFGLYKETNAAGGGPSQSAVVYESIFDNCQFEGIGNAMICDDRAFGSRVVTIVDTLFTCLEFLWNTTKKISTLGAYATIDVGYCAGLRIEETVNGAAWLPGSTAMFNFQAADATYIRGNFGWLFDNCRNATGVHTNKFIEGASISWSSVVLISSQYNQKPWTGRIAWAPAAVSVGQVVVASGAGAGYIAASSGTTTEIPVGIVMYVPAAGSGWCAIAQTGVVNVITSGTITAGTLMRTSTSGAGVTTGSNAPYAIAMNSNGTNKWDVCLRGLV